MVYWVSHAMWCSFTWWEGFCHQKAPKMRCKVPTLKNVSSFGFHLNIVFRVWHNTQKSLLIVSLLKEWTHSWFCPSLNDFIHDFIPNNLIWGRKKIVRARYFILNRWSWHVWSSGTRFKLRRNLGRHVITTLPIVGAVNWNSIIIMCKLTPSIVS